MIYLFGDLLGDALCDLIIGIDVDIDTGIDVDIDTGIDIDINTGIDTLNTENGIKRCEHAILWGLRCPGTAEIAWQ